MTEWQNQKSFKSGQIFTLHCMRWNKTRKIVQRPKFPPVAVLAWVPFSNGGSRFHLILYAGNNGQDLEGQELFLGGDWCGDNCHVLQPAAIGFGATLLLILMAGLFIGLRRRNKRDSCFRGSSSCCYLGRRRRRGGCKATAANRSVTIIRQELFSDPPQSPEKLNWLGKFKYQPCS